jgi:hypothetical protein
MSKNDVVSSAISGCRVEAPSVIRVNSVPFATMETSEINIYFIYASIAKSHNEEPAKLNWDEALRAVCPNCLFF